MVPLVLKVRVDVIELLLAAEAEVKDADSHQKYLTREDPFVALLLYFDAFILEPLPKGHKGGPDLLVKRRLHDLYEGRIPKLYRKAYAVRQEKSQSGAAISDERARTESAQRAANLDKLSTFCNQLNQACGIALLTDKNLERLNPLFVLQLDLVPPQEEPEQGGSTHGYGSRLQSKARQEVANPQGEEPELAEPKGIASSLRRAKQAKATGPWADCTNAHKVLGLTHDSKNKELPYLDVLTHLIEYVLAGQIPQCLRQSFSSMYFLALYKDPKDETKLCPLGIGTALRQIIAAHLCSVYQHRSAAHLLPYNWAIGVMGGTDFVINAMQVQVDQFVNPQDAAAYDASNAELFLDPRRLLTRALVALNIKNMFNSVSQKRCREVLVARFLGLIPFFELLYSKKNKCHYKRADGKATAREQEEGFAQGCPLSRAFVALVLHNNLQELDRKLQD